VKPSESATDPFPVLQYSQLPDLPRAREDFGFVKGFDNKLYVIGGHNREDQEYLDSVLAFDFSSNSWTEVACLPCGGLKAMGVCSMPDGIYVMGGYSARY